MGKDSAEKEVRSPLPEEVLTGGVDMAMAEGTQASIDPPCDTEPNGE